MDFQKYCKQLAFAGYEFYRRGWVFGNSGDFSALISRNPFRLCITASENEKGSLDETNFLEIDDNDEVLQGFGFPPPTTLIHLAIYRLRSEANAVLQTHSVWDVILSDRFFENGYIKIEGYEMLKGLLGVKSHEHCEIIPIIENSQDYIALSHVVENLLRENPSIHAFLIRRNGLYTWGRNVTEAKRHVEILEFLLEVTGRNLLS
ncbi:MAG: methylthioribulose 1-phosphate dehydratase [Pyrinomonadaceae bacterium]|nr:methylthioribulose 1-phosphate dehydratase [Pyrinomonadaceae bacterium]MCX7639530.1 methylthioribulose 1-phosphate dehydratase [Pyrinomonadaceae bacterium]MDW8304419.1 methylthioribulose 1-phosphate dehydratase [Acidobacteriota bacterium]